MFFLHVLTTFVHYQTLYKYLVSKLCLNQTTYIFPYKVHRDSAFEKVADSLYVKKHIDLYMTGSNTYILSGDLTTLPADM